MRVTSLLTESSLTAIAERLYANLTDGSRKLAESALLNANPNLGRPDGFRRGAIIQVPTLPSLTLKTTDFAQENPVSQTREILVQALKGFQAASKEILSSKQTELKGQITLLGQVDFTKARKTHEIPPKAKVLISELEQRLQESKIRHSSLMAALEHAKNDLVK